MSAENNYNFLATDSRSVIMKVYICTYKAQALHVLFHFVHKVEILLQIIIIVVVVVTCMQIFEDIERY